MPTIACDKNNVETGFQPVYSNKTNGHSNKTPVSTKNNPVRQKITNRFYEHIETISMDYNKPGFINVFWDETFFMVYSVRCKTSVFPEVDYRCFYGFVYVLLEQGVFRCKDRFETCLYE